MGRGRALTEREIAQIDILYKKKYSQVEIAKSIKKSRTAVGNYLRQRSSTKEPSKAGRPEKLSPTAKRALVRHALKENLTARRLHEKSGVQVSIRTVQRVLFEDEKLHFGHLKKRSALTPDHIKARRKWAKEMDFLSNNKWKRMVFTDEKRFCLDGPDGQAHYWHDKRIPKKAFSSRQRGGGGIMVWAGISWRGKTELVFVSCKINSVKYCDMLEDHFLPFRDEYYPNGCIFQQDGAPAHTANHTKEFFVDNTVTVLDWPARSPDMNCIENCWGILASKVYEGARQFETVDDLKECLLYEWEKLDMDVIRKLIASMPHRVRELYNKRGGFTRY